MFTFCQLREIDTCSCYFFLRGKLFRFARLFEQNLTTCSYFKKRKKKFLCRIRRNFGLSNDFFLLEKSNEVKIAT